MSANKSNGNAANLTMAERAALAQKQKLASQSPASGTTGSTSIAATTIDDDDWGLGDFGAPSKPSTQPQFAPQPKPSSTQDSLLGFDDDVSPTTSQTTTQKATGSLWDIDDFASPPSKPQEHVDNPDLDFDFGNREDRDFSSTSNTAAQEHGEDDILGMLSKPVEAVRASQQKPANGGYSHSTTPSPQPLPSRSNATRSSSPPPHILGQIVEMGFSVAQAKAALARTETGTDVQAALDMLLGEGSNNPSRSVTPASDRRRPGAGERGYSDEDVQPRRRPAQPQREGSSGTGTPNAEKLIAQASEIGLSVLSKASLFWKEGKEKVQKAYVEASGSVASGTRDTRPKWMQDAGEGSSQPPQRYNEERGAVGSSFRDGDDDYEPSSAFADSPVSSGFNRKQAPPPPQQQRAQQPEPDLFSSEPAEPKIYVSPFRRKKVDLSAPSAPVAEPSRALPPRAAPAPKPKRHLPSCSPSNLSRVVQHKTKGTDAFKLGQFSVAAEEYSKAITLLPSNHLLLVPLHTNRAIARIKCGECKAAIEDASGALSIIGSQKGWESWHPSDEEGGWELENNDSEADGRGGYTVARSKGAEWSDSWGRGVDLKDGWVKAVKRRAEAFEGLEKWKDARKDWEILAGGGGGGWVDANTRQEAVRGLGRCKKMLDAATAGDSAGSSRPAAPAAPKVKPRPRPTPPASTNTAPGVAVQAYRAQIKEAEAEDALKHTLKDSVEAKLEAWKKGKETNLRALLASLDVILWDEVLKEMGKKPGMADLISSGGVKKWYMKAVSRVHPDKLNSNNSTVEQRMIAGGVFGALNEAWLAFKP
ncbi:UBA domain-containing protein 7 [Coprinopsis cinerea okayama7|uniref:UBA domain-containing protein 7 n=1 Tax=Coprinopsis cinerea (strain Okayama-7 / 130 / ATCC MYA-4618 / FGSC 9003) TaxID=240176 RepID=A8N3M3_COPC7|nr:UBA domain-containing protein 7 [Coprinopsis cinerea okayama7\|eukprot:XP_001829489.2 UBA domain-containing protein 7 [Coprinopsis cinerea okayama7\